MYHTEIRGPLILGNKSLGQITTDITSPLYARPKFWWIVGLGISSIMMLLGFWAIYVTIAHLDKVAKILVFVSLTIFSITILSLFTFSWRANLWPGNSKPIFHERATDDKFVILVKKDKVDPGKATSVFKETGASEIIEK